MQQLVSCFCVAAIFSDGLSAFDELAQSFLNLVDEYFVEEKRVTCANWWKVSSLKLKPK